jgi:hypothetical protein
MGWAFFPRRTTGVILLLSLVLSGCVTSKKYKMAKEDMPPAQLLGWSVSSPPAELMLETLIVFKGPGSWKHEARWDEYVVLLFNRGAQPLRIDTVTLIDLEGQPQIPGSDPWYLEKLSYTNWDKYGKTGRDLLAGAGVATMYAGGVGFLAFGGAISIATMNALLIAAPVVMVADVTTVAVINHQNRDKVVKEFARRGLVLPVTVAPGAHLEGSWFFPMTPGPQRLTVKGMAGDAPLELVLDLKRLANLHLRPVVKNTTPL